MTIFIYPSAGSFELPADRMLVQMEMVGVASCLAVDQMKDLDETVYLLRQQWGQDPLLHIEDHFPG